MFLHSVNDPSVVSINFSDTKLWPEEERKLRSQNFPIFLDPALWEIYFGIFFLLQQFATAIAITYTLAVITVAKKVCKTPFLSPLQIVVVILINGILSDLLKINN